MNLQATGMQPDLEAAGENASPSSDLSLKRAKLRPVRQRVAEFNDYGGIAALESEYGLRSKSREDWEHLWRGNPLWRTLSDWPIGWVLEDESERVVGHIGNVPLAYEFDGKPLLAATSRSFVVDARFRPYAVSLLRSFFGQSGVDLFLNTSVNEKAVRLQTAFGALAVPSGRWDRSIFWITGYRGFAASALARRGSGQAIGSPLLGAALFLQDKWKDLQPKRGADTGKFCRAFDSRFEVFWNSLRKSSLGQQLQAVRSVDHLQWHFGPSLQRGDTWVVTTENDAGLTAYAVLSRDDNEDFGLHRVRLVDLQFLPGFEHSIKGIVETALVRCQREGIHMLEAVGFSTAVSEKLSRLSRHSRGLSSWRYFYRANNRMLAAALTSPEAWNPTCYDGDSSL